MKAAIALAIALTLAANLGASDLIINEVSHRGENWVEIHNPTQAPVDLDGYGLMNSMSQDQLQGTVPAQGYLLIVASAKGFYRKFPSASAEIFEVQDGEIGSGLSKEREMLGLVNPRGVLVDLMNWGNPDPAWPNFTSKLWFPGILSQEPYLARMPDGKDGDRPTDFTGVFEPTPGEKNPAPMGLSTASWGKIKALFSGNPKP
jgi:hypothetical protein